MQNISALTKNIISSILLGGQTSSKISDFADDDVIFIGPVKYTLADSNAALGTMLGLMPHDFDIINRADLTEYKFDEVTSIVGTVTATKISNSIPKITDLRITALWKTSSPHPTLLHIHISLDALSYTVNDTTRTNSNRRRSYIDDDKAIRCLSGDGREINIPYSEIIYFTSSKRYVTLFTHSAAYIVRSAISSIQASAPDKFIRIHRSHIVNLAFVADIGGGYVTLKNKVRLPLSRERSSYVKSKFSEFKYE